MDLYYNDLANIQEQEEQLQLNNENTYFSSINIHNITHDDMLNGDGLRVVLWVAGCTHHCKECHNPITWDCKGGIPFTQWEEAEFYEWLSKPWTQGATFSGGDPLHPANREYIGKMMENIKKNYPGKDIWCYTGYTLEKESDGFIFRDANGEQFEFSALKHIDVLVDGRFECETRKKDIEEGKKVLWRGSSNQRIIDVQKTLEEKKIIEKEA